MIVRQYILQSWQQPATTQCARAYKPLSARARVLAQRPVYQHRSPFHTSPSHRQGNTTHYDTLHIPPNSTDKEIKKQFYALSKTYHPDLHPNDPDASKRFVEISEAYATLGSADKRAKYDREVLRSPQTSGGDGGPAGPRGSYSSASGSGPGGRPASGLSRRRTAYRGPPPSFYRSGGWGRHGSKRQAESEKASHTNEAQGRAESNPGGSGGETGSGAAGTGPGGFQQGFDNDVPHFDHEGHFQTQSTIERMRERARSRRTVRRDEDFEYESGTSNSAAFNFVLLLGVLGVVWGVSGLVFGFEKRGKGKSKKEEDEK